MSIQDSPRQEISTLWTRLDNAGKTIRHSPVTYVAMAAICGLLAYFCFHSALASNVDGVASTMNYYAGTAFAVLALTGISVVANKKKNISTHIFGTLEEIGTRKKVAATIVTFIAAAAFFTAGALTGKGYLGVPAACFALTGALTFLHLLHKRQQEEQAP